MGQKWIIDVLADLRAFADQNDMPLLAHQLEATSTVAKAEMASLPEGAPQPANVNGYQTQAALGAARTGQ